MMLNQNEKYLLKYISNINNEQEKKEDLISLLNRFGIKIQFRDYNCVYQIIDELNYSCCDLKI